MYAVTRPLQHGKENTAILVTESQTTLEAQNHSERKAEGEKDVDERLEEGKGAGNRVVQHDEASPLKPGPPRPDD